VGDEQDCLPGLVELCEEVEDRLAVLAVKRADRFIGEQQRW